MKKDIFIVITLVVVTFALVSASSRITFERWYGGSNREECQSVVQTSDGGYILSGYTKSFGDPIYGDIYVVKTDANGDTLWTRTFGGSSSEESFYVQQTSDGDYVIAG